MKTGYALGLLSSIFTFLLITSVHAGHLQSYQPQQCGIVDDPHLGSTVDLGACDSGYSCVNNRCEPSCDSSVFGGPTHDLYVHLPLLLNNDAIIGTSEVNLYQKTRPTTWTSINDISAKAFRVTLNDKFKKASEKTISFNFIPNSLNENTRLVRNNLVSVDLIKGTIYVEIKFKNKKKSVIQTDAIVKNTSSNHLAVRITPSTVDVNLNGKHYSLIFTEDQIPKPMRGRVRIDSYPGKLWDLRLYTTRLEDNEIGELAATSMDGLSDNPYQEGYPNFLCGAYVCEWWPLDKDLEENEEPLPIEKYQYYIKKQDEVFERNVINAGMYKHGDICGFMAWSKGQPNRNLVLSYGIRRTFVKPFSEDKPVNQHWLHENFHAFQGNLKRYMGYGGNKFLLESSASWGAGALSPGVRDTLLGMYTLVPHIPLWSTQSSPIDESIYSRFKGGHQYGAFIFELYVTNYVLNNRFMGDIFNDKRAGSVPAKVMKELIDSKGFDMKQVFTDFAAKVINFDFDNSQDYKDSEQSSCARMYSNDDGYDPETCIEKSPKIAVYFDENGTSDQWATPPSQYRLGSWAFNVYKISTPKAGEYHFELSANQENADYAEFKGKVVIYDKILNEYSYYDLDGVRANQATQLNVDVPEESEVYFVVTSVPDVYKDFEVFDYSFKMYPKT